MRFLCTAEQLLRKVAVKLKACRQDVRNLRIAGSLPLISVGKLLWSWTNKFKYATNLLVILHKMCENLCENMAEPMRCERDGEDPDTAE